MSILDFSYTNSRIRSLKTRLLEPDFLKALASCENVVEIINLLSNTSYGYHINQAVYLAQGTRGIEAGLQNYLVSHVNFLKQRVLSKKALYFILPILERWDVHNLKVILRAHHAGRPLKEMEESFVPLGSLNPELLRELARTTELKDMIDLLYTMGVPYYKPLKEHLFEYEAERNLHLYETELDRFYFEESLRRISSRFFKALDRYDQNKKFTKKMLQLEIDIVNTVTAFKLTPSMLEEEEAQKYFIKGGQTIDSALFLEVYRKESLEEKLKLLGPTPFSTRIKKAFEETLATGFISPVQRALESLLIEEAYRLFKAYPLSVAPVIAYVWAKYNEVVNLRIIIRCKEADLPPEKIMRALILPQRS